MVYFRVFWLNKKNILVNGEKVSLRLRKNQVHFFYDSEALYKKCLSETGEVNFSIVKSELGKVRIAVSSDIYTYLKMSWVLSFSGDFYKHIPGATIDESVTEELRRMRNIISYLNNKNAKGLPFDYDAFDHQPTLDEIQHIYDLVANKSRFNVPVDELSEYDQVVKNTSDGIKKAVLIYRPNSDTSVPSENRHNETVFDVEGSLLSGLRITSIIGNIWNTINTMVNRQILRSMGIHDQNSIFYIRGDDSVILSDSYPYLVLFSESYRGQNIVGGYGKFSIQIQECEFLRQWYYKGRIFGYLGRSVPSITQSKPWSNTAWTPDNVISSVIEAIETCIRRGSDINRSYILVRCCEENWAKTRLLKLKKINKECLLTKKDILNRLSMPISNGGFGSELSGVPLIMKHNNFKIFSNSQYVKASGVDKWNPHLESYWNRYFFTNYKRVIAPGNLEAGLNELLGATIVSDDNREAMKKIRSDYDRKMSNMVEDYSELIIPDLTMILISRIIDDIVKICMNVSNIVDIESFISLHSSNQYKDYKIIKELEEIRILRLFKFEDIEKNKWKELVNNTRKFEHKYKLNRGLAIEFLTDGFKDNSMIFVHPFLRKPLSHLIIDTLFKNPGSYFFRHTCYFVVIYRLVLYRLKFNLLFRLNFGSSLRY